MNNVHAFLYYIDICNLYRRQNRYGGSKKIFGSRKINHLFSGYSILNHLLMKMLCRFNIVYKTNTQMYMLILYIYTYVYIYSPIIDMYSYIAL